MKGYTKKHMKKWARNYVDTHCGQPILYVNRPYIHAIVRIKFNNKDIVGHGFAKQNPRDEWNLSLGTTIAVGRASKEAAEQLQEAIFMDERGILGTQKISDDTATTSSGLVFNPIELGELTESNWSKTARLIAQEVRNV
jgi:hypothetical protein